MMVRALALLLSLSGALSLFHSLHAQEGTAETARRESAQEQHNEPEITQAKSEEDSEAAPAGTNEPVEEVFQQLEDLLSQKDEFSQIADRLLTQIKQEFRKNEKLIQELQVGTNAHQRRARELRERQLILAQQHLELETRKRNRHQWHGGGSVIHKMHQRFQQFQQDHPGVAQTPEVLRRFGELTQRAMQLRMHGRHRNTETLKLTDTLHALSSNGWKHVDHQKLSVAHPAAQEGAIPSMRSQMQHLLKLRWDDERLRLDRRHWDTAFAGQNFVTIRAAVDQRLKEAGYQDDEEDNLMANAFQAQTATSNVGKLFQELQRGQAGRSHRGGSGSDVDAGFTDNHLRASLRVNDTRFELQLEELHSPRRLLRVIDDDGCLSILLVGDSVQRFEQSTDGKLHVVDIAANDTIVHRHDSFAALYREQPRFVEERLFALLDHLGILLPATRFDADVIDRMMQRLAMETAELKREVDKLAADLDSAKYITRESAFADLNENLDEYYDFIYLKQDDPTLSVEARARLAHLLNNSETRESAASDRIIAALQLVEDAEYLEELQHVVDADEAQLISARLESIRESAVGH